MRPTKNRKHNYIFLALLTVLAGIIACDLSDITQTPTTEPPGTPISTETPIPTSTTSPTATPTETPWPTPTQQVEPTGPNLLVDPQFEGPYTKRDPQTASITVAEAWQPFYCAPPYTAEDCPALRLGDGNPTDLLMGIPEYRPTDLETRVVSGLAQQWFCFFRACRAGVYQVVETTPGSVCEAGAWVQTWSAGDWIGDAGPWTSFYETDDERANSTWRIGVDPTGGGDAFADGVQWSEIADYSAGHFDHFALISYRFVATGARTTVFFENLRLWPFAHNDSYLDDAFVRCSE